jgi:hypothetical protein
MRKKRVRHKKQRSQRKKQVGVQSALFSFLQPIAVFYTAKVK